MSSVERGAQSVKRALSRKGCLTCKSRKVKCDEAKLPTGIGQVTCRRCHKAFLQCEYTDVTLAGMEDLEQKVNMETLPYNLTTDHLQETAVRPCTSIYQVGVSLISCFSGIGIAYCGFSVLSKLVDGLPNTSLAASIAINALRALCDRRAGYGTDKQNWQVTVNNLYGQALKTFVAEKTCNTEATDFHSQSITIIALGAIELIQRRRHNAYQHIVGLKALSENAYIPGKLHIQLNFLLKVYDLQLMLYSNGVRLPLVQPIALPKLKVCTEGNLEEYCVDAVHTCHAFIANLHRCVLLGTELTETLSELDHHIAQMETTVELIDCMLQRTSRMIPEQTLLMVKGLSLMTRLQLRQIMCTTETSWDVFEPEFFSIVEIAEGLIGMRQNDLQIPLFTPFTPQVGVIPPLNLTALKCRNVSLRRRAVKCLRQAGVEGPFVGKLLAAVAMRCIEIEEESLLTECLPAEHLRLFKSWTLENNGTSDGTIWPSVSEGTTQVQFVRGTIPSPSMQLNILTSAYFENSERLQAVQQIPLDRNSFDAWTEVLHFD